MFKKLWNWTVFCLVFFNNQVFSEPIQWVNAENAQSFSIGWSTPGDFFSVNVLVDGYAPFTCAMISLAAPVIGLGENGECDIRSSSLDGEITIEITGLNDAGDILGKEQITIFKDTIRPQIYMEDVNVYFSDHNLDLQSILCTLNDEPLPDCKSPSHGTGLLRVKASDFAGNHSYAEFQLKKIE